MKTYNSIQEARKAGCKQPVRYFVNGKEVPPCGFRQADGEVTVYRSGLELIAEKKSNE